MGEPYGRNNSSEKKTAKSVFLVNAKPPAIGRVKRPFAIDVHAHISDPMAGKFIREQSGRTGGGFVTTSGVSKAMIAAQKRHMDYVRERQRDIPLRLRELDAMGIDMQVISSSPAAGCYWASGETGLEMSAHNNDLIAETVAKYPDRFVGVGTVPLQDASLAVRELRRCVLDLDLRGVIIGSVVEGIELGDKNFGSSGRNSKRSTCPVLSIPTASPTRNASENITCGTPSRNRWRKRSPCPRSSMNLKTVVGPG